MWVLPGRAELEPFQPESDSSETTDGTDDRYVGAGFVMVENFFHGHPPGEHPLHRNPFFIRVIREIRGFNCCFWVQRFPALPTTDHPSREIPVTQIERFLRPKRSSAD